MDEKESKLVSRSSSITDNIIDGIHHLKYSKEINEFKNSITKLEENKYEINKLPLNQ